MKHFKQEDLSSIPWTGLKVCTKAKIKLFWNMVMLHIKLKPTMHGSNYFAHRHTLNPGGGGGGGAAYQIRVKEL